MRKPRPERVKRAIEKSIVDKVRRRALEKIRKRRDQPRVSPKDCPDCDLSVPYRCPDHPVEG